MTNQPPASTPPPAPEPSANSALLDEVERRNYGTGSAAVNPAELSQPLPEVPAGFSSGTPEADPFAEQIEQARNKKDGDGAAPADQPGAKPRGKSRSEPDFSNPDLRDLPKEKAMQAAENLAKMIISGYERLNALADNSLQISEKKIFRMRTAARIDMETLIPVESGGITFEEFIHAYNEQTKGTIAVEPEFKEDVLPVLTSVLAKRGHGLSDEQYLVVAFGQHAAINVQKYLAQKSTFREVMAFGLEMTRRNRNGQESAAPPRQDPPPPPPAAAPVVNMYDQGPPYAQTAEAGGGGGAAVEYQLPTYGGKEKKNALHKAARRGQARTRSAAASAAIAPDKPSERRQRVRGIGGKKNPG